MLAAAVAAGLQGLAAAPAHADPGCAGIISSLMPASCPLHGDQTLTIEKSGLIVVDEDPAIEVYGENVNITNHGLIQAAADTAIDNYAGLNTSVTNTGAIKGGSALFNRAGQTMGKLTNSGLIEGGYSTIVNSGTIGEVVNSGIIRTLAPAVNYAFYNGGTITHGIKNSGTFEGIVDIGSATLYLEGDKARIIGGVSGEDGGTVVVNGKFTTEGGFSVDHFSVARGGQLTIGHEESFKVRKSAFKNLGTVVVPVGKTAIITGDYEQSANSTLVIGAAGAKEHGKLVVEGTATFQDGTKLQVSVSKKNTLANKMALGSVVEAESLKANLKTIVIGDDSELFNFEPVLGSNTIRLTAVLDEKPDDGKGDVDNGSGGESRAVSNRVSAEGFGQGMSAAFVIDGFVANPNNTGDMVNVVDAFGRLGSQKEVADAVAQTLPLMSANLNQVTLGSMQGVNRVIQSRQGGLGGMSSGDGFLADKHLWFKPLASFADQDDRDGIAGYRANTYGFVFGGDAVVGKSSRLGLAFSYARTDVDGKSTARYNSADVDAYQLIAYGSHSISAWPDVEVNWQADIGMNSNDGKRTMNFGGLGRTAKSDFDSTTAHLGAGISKGFQVREATRITPALRLDYFRIHNESYTETGADTLNLRVGSQTSEQLIAMLEGRVSHKLNERTALMASLGVGYDLIGEDSSITSSYVGGGAAFSTPGMDASRWLGRAGLGLSYQASEATEITARYDLEGRDGFLAQTASVNVRWAF